jgi:hypothetical protein
MDSSRPFASPLLDVWIVPRGPHVVVQAAGELDIGPGDQSNRGWR